MTSLRFPSLKYLLPVLVLGAILSACSQQPSGPVAGGGASYGALGSQDMSDYYYKKQAGWVYAFKNVQHIYDNVDDENPATELIGADDTVFSMGYDGLAPRDGDSLFRYQIKYRLTDDSHNWQNGAQMSVYYVGSSPTNGGFIDFNTDPSTISGSVFLGKPRPRPVSTDTILAGIAGLVRTQTDDFTNAANYVWKTDTLWTTSKGDSTFIWEKFTPGGPLLPSRLIFVRNFTQNTKWTYDQLLGGTTSFKVVDPDQQVTVDAGTYNHCVKVLVNTTGVSDDIPISEYKWFACGTGIIKQKDVWRMTTDGTNFTKQDFVRTLKSCTHP